MTRRAVSLRSPLAPAELSAARLIDFFDLLAFTFFFDSTVSGEIDNFLDAKDLLLAFLALGVTGSTTTGNSSGSSGSIGALMVSAIAWLSLAAMDSITSMAMVASMIAVVALRAISSLAGSMIAGSFGGSIAFGARGTIVHSKASSSTLNSYDRHRTFAPIF
jgi:hypothetical protein